MTNTYLTWLSNEALTHAIEHVYRAYSTSLLTTSLSHLQRNILDPFSLAFETILYGKTVDECIKDEALRQAQKTLGKAVGEFHQIVLGSCEGWVNLGTGDESHLDVRREDGSIFAEIKNKFNTTNDDSGRSVFNKMRVIANQYPNANVYHVQIIRKRLKPYDEMWKRLGNNNPRIRLVSGEKFYEMVTGIEDALEDLYSVLPDALHHFVERAGQIAQKESTVVSEIEEKVRKQRLETTDLFQYLFQHAYHRKR
jgi:hypothetical protein